MGSFARTAGAWKRTLLFAVGALLVMAAASRPRRRPPTDTDVRIEQPRKSPQAGDVTSDRPRDGRSPFVNNLLTPALSSLHSADSRSRPLAPIPPHTGSGPDGVRERRAPRAQGYA